MSTPECPCFVVSQPDSKVYADIGNLSLSTTRRVLFTRYRNGLATEDGPGIIYDNSEDLLSAAEACAERIANGMCQKYTVANYVRGRQNFGRRVVERSVAVAHPSRYRPETAEF